MALTVGIDIGKALLVIIFLQAAFGYLTLIERKLLGRFQLRPGPNRAGPFGLLQPLADGVKLLLKEEIIPAGVDRFVFLIAPMLSLLGALMAFAVIPFGSPVHIFGRLVPLQIAGPSLSLLYVFAVASLGVYGIVLGGWSSQNKYGLLGGLRSSAQIISYELAMGLSVIGVLLAAGSADLNQIVSAQTKEWFVFPQIVGFIVYFICAIAETNRAPFDLPEAEQELVAGYHTEYTGMKFAMFFMAEYINMITVSALATTLFLGGWHGPSILPSYLWFLIKVAIFLFVFVWLRATLPRLRYDRLMAFGWKVLLPVALLNALGTAAWVALVHP
ncbi:MAG: NADH-quinone oxidoreductase subunit NuoH [Sulfobacillus sp.]